MCNNYGPGRDDRLGLATKIVVIKLYNFPSYAELIDNFINRITFRYGTFQFGQVCPASCPFNAI